MYRNATSLLILTSILLTGCGKDDESNREELEKEQRQQLLQTFTDQVFYFDVTSEKSACEFAAKKASDRKLNLTECKLSENVFSIGLQNSGTQKFNVSDPKERLTASLSEIEDVSIKEYFELLVSAIDYSKSRISGM